MFLHTLWCQSDYVTWDQHTSDWLKYYTVDWVSVSGLRARKNYLHYTYIRTICWSGTEHSHSWIVCVLYFLNVWNPERIYNIVSSSTFYVLCTIVWSIDAYIHKHTSCGSIPSIDSDALSYMWSFKVYFTNFGQQIVSKYPDLQCNHVLSYTFLLTYHIKIHSLNTHTPWIIPEPKSSYPLGFLHVIYHTETYHRANYIWPQFNCIQLSSLELAYFSGIYNSFGVIFVM